MVSIKQSFKFLNSDETCVTAISADGLIPYYPFVHCASSYRLT